MGENPVHQPLIGSADVLQPKRHDLIAITGEFCHECGVRINGIKRRGMNCLSKDFRKDWLRMKLYQ